MIKKLKREFIKKNNIKLPSGSFYFYQINYICNTPDGILVVSDEKKQFNCSGIWFINQMASFYYRSFESISRAIRINLGIKTNVPIYINKGLIFFPIKCIRSYDNIWINFNNVLCYYLEEKDVYIKFKNLETIKLDISIKKLRKQIENVNQVASWVEN